MSLKYLAKYLTFFFRVMRTSVPTKPKRQKAKQDVNESKEAGVKLDAANTAELDAGVAELDTEEKDRPLIER